MAIGYMIVVKIATFGFIALLISVGMLTPSFAHTTVEVEQYKIEAGWGIEPPVVGIRNDIVFKITESGETEGTYRGITSRDVTVDVQIPIEDVESTSVLDFPPTSSEGSADVFALKNAISSLQQDISKLKSGETNTSSNGGAAYDFAIFGLSIAAAAIILAIIALIKRK